MRQVLWAAVLMSLSVLLALFVKEQIFFCYEKGPGFGHFSTPSGHGPKVCIKIKAPSIKRCIPGNIQRKSFIFSFLAELIQKLGQGQFLVFVVCNQQDRDFLFNV